MKTEIPEGYKNSPVGIIPEEWEVRKLGEICTNFKSGQSITSPRISYSDKYPVYGGNGLRGYTHSFTHSGDHILIGRQGALCGNINFVTGENFISEHAIAVKTDLNNDIRFWALKLDYLDLNRLSESSAQPGLSVEKLIKLKVSIPPLLEQKKIAEILTMWDVAIEKQTLLIEKLELRKRGLMQQLLTGKKRLKGFDGEWRKVCYSEIVKEINSKLKWNDEELYKLVSVRRRSGGLFERESLYGKEIQTKNLRPIITGDFLISKMQIVHGASGLVTEEFNDMKISGSYVILNSKNKNILDMCYFNLWSQMPHFYHQAFISSYGVHIEKMTFSLDTFLSFGMTLPPIKEQKAIIKVISVVDKEIHVAKEKLEQLNKQKKGLMQVLLTGKKRVITTTNTQTNENIRNQKSIRAV
jgi:type I restriction enzyme S subunit